LYAPAKVDVKKAKTGVALLRSITLLPWWEEVGRRGDFRA
jgi:hypothetical protein